MIRYARALTGRRRSSGLLVAVAALSALVAPGVATAVDAPVCPSFSLSTPRDTALNLPRPPCVDYSGHPLTTTIVTPPQHGTVVAPTSLSDGTYTPAAGYVGPDSIAYKVNNGESDSNVATVSITVTDPTPVRTDWEGPRITWVGPVTWDRQGLVHVAATCDEACTVVLRLEAPSSRPKYPFVGPTETLQAPAGQTMTFALGPPMHDGAPVTVGVKITGNGRDTLGNDSQFSPLPVPDHPTAGPQQPVRRAHHGSGSPRRGTYSVTNGILYFNGRWILARGAAASVPPLLGSCLVEPLRLKKRIHVRHRKFSYTGKVRFQTGQLHFTGHWTTRKRIVGTSTFKRGSCRDTVHYTARWVSTVIPKPLR